MAAAAAGPGPGPGPGAAEPLAVLSGAPTVTLWVSSSLNAFRAHKRYSRGLTIAELKCKLELLVGSPAACMELQLYGPDEAPRGRLAPDAALLGSFPADDGCRLHVIDHSGARHGEFDDVSRVPKYEMPDSEYAKRPESLRAFLQRRQLGRFAEAPEAPEQPDPDAIPVGARCQVRVPGQPTKLGTVMYVGECRFPVFPVFLQLGMPGLLLPGVPAGPTDFKPGCWVGVRYDEPLGKHDGSVQGRRYFECGPKYGAFVRPPSVTVGDFPPEDDGLDDEM
ncbi:LOW QUALITY PROTEIN: tubulin-folding cofactor B [Eudromia elegans]